MMKKEKRKIAAIILAAGQGSRAGDEDLKQYRKLGDGCVLMRAIHLSLSCSNMDPVVVVRENDLERFISIAGSLAGKVQIVFGGKTRQQSSFYGLLALKNSAPDIVLIHDGVRPFLGSTLVSDILDAVSPTCGAIPALPLTETIKRTDKSGHILETINRADLYAAQTPQAFPYLPFMEAHTQANKLHKSDLTDDASVAEWAGIAVKVVRGCVLNQKLTWKEDIEMTDKLLSHTAFFPDVRTGNGYDVHAFEQGDKVILCGVLIPHDKALVGHSDADVAFHALTDALLAASGSVDIGHHFPPSDPRWRGAASSIFLEHAVNIVRKKKARIANADITLICEAPHIAPHREAMIKNTMKILEISEDRISIKATTNEKMGFIGRKEGIAAIATVSVVYPGSLPSN